MACVRHLVDGDMKRAVRSFKTTTQGLMGLSEWLSAEDCTRLVMEAKGVYCGRILEACLAHSLG